VCVILQEAKNLTAATESKTVAGKQNASIEAQIVNYLIYLKNDGRRDSTIEARDFQLRRLIHLGADLNDPESVKRVIAALDRSESYKLLLCIAYEGFALKNGVAWTRPSYKQQDKLPFVPHESEIDALISGSGKKTATLLQVIKETAMRLGEAWQVEWADFDPQTRRIVCNHPEKNSRSRAFNVSVELSQMIQSLPHNSQYIFTCSRQPIGREDRKTHLAHVKRPIGLLGHQRLRVAQKLKTPRIALIHFHSLRHWKATKLKHQGFDLFDIAAFLGHRSIKNTVIYVHLEKTCYPDGGDDYIGKAATTQTEKLALIEAGFEYVSTDPDGTQYFRKRK
jgi:integrase